MSEASDSDFPAIRAASDRWMRAWKEQDRAVLEELLAPDYALIIASAPDHRFDRSSWLDLPMGAYVCTRFGYEAVQFRCLSSEIVAMSAIADFDATLAGVDRSGRFFVVDLWRRAGSGWQVSARYSSPPPTADTTVASMVRMGVEE